MVGSARLLITAKAFCVQHGFVSASLNTRCGRPQLLAQRVPQRAVPYCCGTSGWRRVCTPSAARAGVPFCEIVLASRASPRDQSRAAEAYRARVGRLLDAWWNWSCLLVSYRPLAIIVGAAVEGAFAGCLRTTAASGRICATRRLRRASVQLLSCSRCVAQATQPSHPQNAKLQWPPARR